VPANSLPDWVLAERRAIGMRIRKARMGRGLSIDQLAEATYLDRKTVIRTELGRHAASIDNLLLIARALGTPLSALVREDAVDG
jgi:transcriptional regulator with XRE-family HTH domain